MNTFGGRLKAARIRANKTQQEMADLIGIERAAYTSYETGRTRPPIDKLSTISSVLSITSDWLLGLTDETELDCKASAGDLSANSADMFPENTLNIQNIVSWLNKLKISITTLTESGDEAVAEAKKMNADFNKKVKKQKEYDADYDVAIAIRRWAAEFIASVCGITYQPDAFASYLRYEISLPDLFNPSRPKAKMRMKDAIERDAYIWGNLDVQNMIEKMVKEQVEKQLKETQPDMTKSKGAK